jgi:hypothetical protein
MRISLLSIALFFALAVPVHLQSQSGVPHIFSAEPASGRVGDVLTARGVNLGQESVAELFLTDGTTDAKVVMVEQTATSIRFKILPGVKPGRPALMVLTKGEDAKLIEEPVKVTIEAEKPIS